PYPLRRAILGMSNAGVQREELRPWLPQLERALQHRRPDDAGYFTANKDTAGLTSTRLAIQDLSATGHQPMRTADGRYTIVFNGEIYNFKQLREELEAEGETFKSGSDTEVILRMYVRYGPDCVREFAGMFGIA